MDWKHSISAAQINGGVAMRRIALETLDALHRADLSDTAQMLQERLFSRDPASLVERDEQNPEAWRFKAMAELLLLDVTDAATAEHLSHDERRDRIAWAIEMSGF